jgi:exopolysaccharide production protein ExoZ
MGNFNLEPGRYTSLQIGRGLAALIVVLHHTVGRAHVAGIGPGLGQGFGFGFLGVDFFFVLSGFIIAYTLSKPGTGVASFLWRRAIRLFPVFWLVFAVSGLAVWVKPSLLGHAVHYSVVELVQAALLIRQDITDGRSNPPIVGVAWTLHHEVLFYAAAALWLWRPRLGLALGAVLLLASLGTPQAYPATYLLNPLNLEFAFGLLAFWLHRRLSLRAAAGLVGGGALLLLLMWRTWPPLDELVNNSRVWSAGLPIALMVCGIAALERLHGLSAQRSELSGGGAARAALGAFTRLGDWSYALYLLHYPVMLVCLKLFRALLPQPSPAQVLLYFACTALVAVACAAVTHLGFERPVQQMLSRLGRSRGL